MDVGNNGMGVCDVVLKLGNHGIGVRDGYVCIHRELGLEDLKDPVELRPPAGDCFFIILCTEVSGNRISSTLLNNFSLDLRHRPAVDR